MRTRLLTACISLVLCVGAWSLPSLLFRSNESPDNFRDEQIMETNGGTPFIEVSGHGEYRLYDETAVNRIITLLNPPTSKPETVCDQDKSNQYAVGGFYSGTDEAFVREYRITVTHVDGTQTVYTLMGTRLTNEETGEVTLIVGQDLLELKKLLGLSEEGEN